jgi:hypothetical protein
MKLSEAMRAGIALTQPTQHIFLKEDHSTEKITHACALGACYVGVEGGDAEFRTLSDWLIEQWPELISTQYHNPSSDCVCLDNIIFDLNDSKGWTRERIADWLEGEGL